MRKMKITQSGKRADLYIIGDIAEEKWNESDATESALLEKLQNTGAQEVHVHIDSLGGDVKAAWGMYNTLRAYKGQVITHADGWVASAAIYPFMAGEKRVASDLSAFFLHQMASRVEGNAKDLREEADALEKIGAIAQLAIAERSGMTADEVYQMMDKNTWLTPEEAVQCGLATETKRADGGTYTQSLRREMVRAMQQHSAGMAPAPPAKRDQSQTDEKPEAPTKNQPIMQKLFAKKE